MKQALTIFCILFTSYSCNKKETEVPVCSDGFIYWGGDYAVDGLGWYFAKNRSDGWTFQQLKEEELPGEVKNKTDSTAVSICLQKTKERAPCFCAQQSYFYKIVSVQKK